MKKILHCIILSLALSSLLFLHAQKTEQVIASVSETSNHSDMFTDTSFTENTNEEFLTSTASTILPEQQTSTSFVLIIAFILCAIIALIVRSRIKTNTLKLF